MPDLLESKKPSLSRRERERLRRRQAMLDAAQAVFAEKGYAQATLDEIAERAEFGKGTLYNYFEGGKEEILFAIFDEVYDGICALIERFFAEEDTAPPTRESFRKLIKAIVTHFLQNEEAFMILTKEAHQMIFDVEEENVAHLTRHRRRVVDHVVPYLEKAMEAGHLKELPPRPVAHVLLGNIHGYLMFAHPEATCPSPSLPTETRRSPGEAADFLTTILFDGLLAEPSSA